MLVKFILVGLVGSLITLDRTAAFQVMISRPLLASSITGLLLGRPLMGLAVGAVMELLFINRSPVGGESTIHDTLAAIVAAAAVILADPAQTGPARPLIVLGVLLAPPVGWLGGRMESYLQQVNGRLFQRAGKDLNAGGLGNTGRWVIIGLALTFVSGFVFIIITLPLCYMILHSILPYLAKPVLLGLDLMFFLIPLIGVAAVLAATGVKRWALAFSAVFLMSFTIITLF